ncbi:MAG: hypothetical protein WC503_01420 [Candidatus Shapirobacteria bacterium]
MRYKVKKFIGAKAQNSGWQISENNEGFKLKNNLESVFVKITRESAVIEVSGSGEVLIVRENKTARLVTTAKGKIKIGDKIWLLNETAKGEYQNGERNNFEGAAIMMEFTDEKIENRQSIYVNEKPFFQEKNNKSLNMILGGVVFVLLIAGTFLGYQKKTTNEQNKKFEQTRSEVEAKILEIDSVRSVNIETALQLARNAEDLIGNSGITEKKYISQLTELKTKIGEIIKTLGGENVEYEIAYDTSLIAEGNDLFSGMAIKDGVAYLWSAALGQINMIDPLLKSKEKIVEDERIKSWLGIFNNGEKWYGYNQNKIYEIKRNELVETEISGVQTIGEMTGWNGLTYVIDNGNQNISKLTQGEGNIWLKNGITLKETISSISIDSSIWVLGASGKIYKYTQGVDENFEMSFIPASTSAKKLRTSDKVNFLADIIDENTVVIYGKDGKILGKYNFSNIKINDIGIEKQNNAVLVLAKNGKIYRIKIK